MLLKSDITDPVSGFFMIRSEVADKVAARLSGVGTKILIDLLASAPGPLSVTELPYRFRGRNSGSSKLDWFTILEYLALARREGEWQVSAFQIYSFRCSRGQWDGRASRGVARSAGCCRRELRCCSVDGNGNRGGLELTFKQYLDLSRIPARRLGRAARPRIVHGDLRSRRCRQRPDRPRPLCDDPDVVFLRGHAER